MNAFKRNKFLVKAGLGSVLIKRFGASCGLSEKGSGYHKLHMVLKHEVRTETSNSCSLILKDCDEKITADRNPWGKPRRTHKK